MKKTFIKPSVEVSNLQAQAILAGSGEIGEGANTIADGTITTSAGIAAKRGGAATPDLLLEL